MLQGADIVVLAKLLLAPGNWTLRGLEEELGVPRSVAQRGLARLSQARLIEHKRGRANVLAAEELFVHGLKYLFPPVQVGEARGVPTAWAAKPLVDELAPSDSLPPVWPDPLGEVRGLGIEPLHPAAPSLARKEHEVAILLGLLDALRLGDARIRELAEQRLSAMLSSARQRA